MTTMDLTEYSKGQLNEMLPEDSRWTPDQLRRVSKDELVQSVKESQGMSDTTTMVAEAPKETNGQRNGPKPRSTAEPQRLPMKLITTKNQTKITEQAQAFFRERGDDQLAWTFEKVVYSDDRGKRAEIKHMTAGQFAIWFTSRGYIFEHIG